MFLILNSSKLIVDISPHAHYVRRQDNGVVAGCGVGEADAIYSQSSDAFYPLAASGYLQDRHTLAEVSEVPSHVTTGYYYYHAGEFTTSEEKQAVLAQARAQEDMAEILVDQEYRLILLELGVV